MLVMVIESLKPGRLSAIRERIQRNGRMLPEGVIYHGSWVESSGARCFQLMEASSREQLQSWTRHWNDLVDFEIVPVMTSTDFWAVAARLNEAPQG
jgi:hypothetical protein